MENIKNIIIKNSTPLFAKYGLKKTTMDEIAAKCGVAKGTLYNYFKNKEELFTHIVSIESQSFVSRIKKRVDTQEKAIDKAYTFARSSLELIFDYINLYNIQANFFDDLWEMHPILEKKYQTYLLNYKSILKDIITHGVETGEFRQLDIDLLTDALILLIQETRFPLNKRMLTEVKDQKIKKFEIILDVILHGLCQ
jgi:AcrR family transcriptional regulator